MIMPVFEAAGIMLVLGFLALFCIWGLHSEPGFQVPAGDSTSKPTPSLKNVQSSGAVTPSRKRRRRRHAAAVTAHQRGCTPEVLLTGVPEDLRA